MSLTKNRTPSPSRVRFAHILTVQQGVLDAHSLPNHRRSPSAPPRPSSPARTRSDHPSYLPRPPAGSLSKSQPPSGPPSGLSRYQALQAIAARHGLARGLGGSPQHHVLGMNSGGALKKDSPQQGADPQRQQLMRQLQKHMHPLERTLSSDKTSDGSSKLKTLSANMSRMPGRQALWSSNPPQTNTPPHPTAHSPPDALSPRARADFLRAAKDVVVAMTSEAATTLRLSKGKFEDSPALGTAHTSATSSGSASDGSRATSPGGAPRAFAALSASGLSPTRCASPTSADRESYGRSPTPPALPNLPARLSAARDSLDGPIVLTGEWGRPVGGVSRTVTTPAFGVRRERQHLY